MAHDTWTEHRQQLEGRTRFPPIVSPETRVAIRAALARIDRCEKALEAAEAVLSGLERTGYTPGIAALAAIREARK